MPKKENPTNDCQQKWMKTICRNKFLLLNDLSRQDKWYNIIYIYILIYYTVFSYSYTSWNNSAVGQRRFLRKILRLLMMKTLRFLFYYLFILNIKCCFVQDKQRFKKSKKNDKCKGISSNLKTDVFKVYYYQSLLQCIHKFIYIYIYISTLATTRPTKEKP